MEVVDAIVAAIQSIPDILLLDSSSDPDHNRAVITFAGSPEAVVEAAFRAVAEAAKHINLDTHRGAHPRIGATDVLPLVPLEGVTLDDCVALARQLGERVGRELNIPVYLYEAAATRPEQRQLENIRRGQYEGLKAAMGNDPQRAPDFGPAMIGTAGATVIGARLPLIAFNVYLTTTDVSIARKIARAIRESSGGLPYVKALGLFVDGLAQVSINLTDYTRTPLGKVIEVIQSEAVRYGVAIHHSELIGLIPRAALIDAECWSPQVNFHVTDQILETRLEKKLREQKSANLKTVESE